VQQVQNEKEINMPRSSKLSLLTAALLIGMASAQADVSEKATEAKDATVHAVHKTGEVVSDAASTAVSATKRAAHKTADVAVKVYDKTKQVTKEAVGAAAGETKKVAGKVEDAVSK
jgi:hypothetical protein